MQVPALRDIDVDVEPGEFVAIVGQSGSGKSTLMNLIGCLDVPSAGRDRLSGRDVGEHSDDDLADVRNLEIGFISRASSSCRGRRRSRRLLAEYVRSCNASRTHLALDKDAPIHREALLPERRGLAKQLVDVLGRVPHAGAAWIRSAELPAWLRVEFGAKGPTRVLVGGRTARAAQGPRPRARGAEAVGAEEGSAGQALASPASEEGRQVVAAVHAPPRGRR